MEQVAKQTKRVPPQLADAPQCPPGMLYLWSWFHELYTGHRLTHTEVYSWCQLRNIKLDDVELQLLYKLERILIEVSKNG